MEAAKPLSLQPVRSIDKLDRTLHQTQAIIDKATALFYEQALVQFQGKYVGAKAAIVPSRVGKTGTDATSIAQQELNYGEIFIRDNVPVMILLLLEGKGDIVRNFLDTSLSLQSTQTQTMGIFPSSFVEHHGKIVADYGQRAIGRVCSVDATLWWVILAHIYVQRTGDRAWATRSEVQQGIQRFLDLIFHARFHDVPLLQVPDGAFMIDRPLDVWGAPLEIQTLLQGALLSAAGLIRIDLEEKGCCSTDETVPLHDAPDAMTRQQIHYFSRAIAWAKRLRRYLLKHYWIDNKIVQTLRQHPTEQYGEAIVNEYNIHPEMVPHWLQHWLGEDGGYLLGNIRTGCPDFRFFTLGNCLGAMFDVISPNQQQALFQLIARNRADLIAEMPLRICHPPLENADWRSKTGCDRKNTPWSYHNAGHWPCLVWFLGAAILRHQQNYPDAAHRVGQQSDLLLESCYELLLKRLPQQKWAEYFDGPTGLWAGQQTRYYQTWTITGLLITHHLLRVNPDDAQIMNVPTIKSLSQVKLAQH